MTTRTLTFTNADIGPAQISVLLVSGLLLLGIAGFAQASVLHDSAHNTRHALAFPCH